MAIRSTAMLGGGWILTALVMAGPPPPPSLEHQAPIEGPARPPSPAGPPGPAEGSDELAIEPEVLDDQADSNDESDAEPEPPIEFTPPPSELESPTSSTEPQHAEIGQAPSDGAGLLVAGAVIIPSAALLLYLSFYDPAHQPASTITMGVGFGLIGAGLIGFGGYRRCKLQRWARARRVIVQRQGAGLLVVGGLTAAAGVSAIGGGIVVLALTSGPGAGAGGATLIGAGVLLGAVAAAPLVIGKRRRVEYQQTGGWIRRPLTHIEWAPRLMAGRDRLGLGVMGRF